MSLKEDRWPRKCMKEEIRNIRSRKRTKWGKNLRRDTKESRRWADNKNDK